MVDTTRQVPAPSATAWAIDLRDTRGPIFVVLRCTGQSARAALVEHLADVGPSGSVADARALVDPANAEYVAVIW